MITVAQLYTGGVGSEIVRRLAGHPQLELVGVLVHSPDKAGVDSGELVGAPHNGVTTTLDVYEIITLRPDAAIYSGMLGDHELIRAATANHCSAATWPSAMCRTAGCSSPTSSPASASATASN